jgi:4-amino-4-deoxy-L-arabinose transferase-like glycosyltransferase
VVLATGFHVLYGGWIGLTPQEAYYWQWSRYPDLSYFDHPPLAAWTIRATTGLLGTSARAIRMAAALHSALSSLFLFLAGRRLFGGRTALLALAVMLATPLFALGQTVITPDGPLLAGWMAAFYFTVRALDEERGQWLLAAGAAAGLACLGKYPGFLLFLQVLAALLLDARGRRLLKTPWPWLGVLLAAALFSPVVLWNAEHGWASFGFQTRDRAAQVHGLSLRLTGRFLGLQALAASPLLFVVLIMASAAAARRWREPAFRLCALFSAPFFLLLLMVSPLQWVKMNWAAPAYPAALLAAAALWRERPDRWRGLGVASVAVAVLGSAFIHLMPLVPALPFPARDETTSGWGELSARVEAERRRLGGDPFVVGCDYKVASELAFHLPGRPETQSAGAFGEPGLQYDYWLDRAPLAGREGLVVYDPRSPSRCRERAREICRPLEALPPLTVRRGRAPITTFEIFRCRYPPALLGRGAAGGRPAVALAGARP